MPQPIPVHLITGLLGSGKTTCLKQLIQRKPQTENWAVLINEFGEVDIDAAQIQALTKTQSQIEVQSIAGGCICCTAHLGLVNAINQTLGGSTKIDRILIEPTGLGHPAKILDTLQKTIFTQPLVLQKILCIITPAQLTPERWAKSAVMRDLVTLADTILLNKIDLSSQASQQLALNLLRGCYPPKNDIIHTQQAKIELNTLLQTKPSQPFTLLHKQSSNMALEKIDPHQRHTTHKQQNHPSILKHTERCLISLDASDSKRTTPLTMGWVWSNHVQFNRTHLKTFFNNLAQHLLRAKGIIKTGNEWQLIHWVDGQLSFEDIAWRQDSRLECIFHPTLPQAKPLTAQIIETQLQNAIHQTTNN